VSRAVDAITLLGAACLVASAVSGCAADASASAGPIAVAGFTRVDPVVITGPALQRPTLDVTVGIAQLQTPALLAGQRKKAAAAAVTRGPSVAGVLRSVPVNKGDTVKKGQVVAVLDDSMLALGVESAKAAYRKAVATADTMKSTASDIRDQRVTVYAARSTLKHQAALLGTQKTKLAQQLSKLQAAAPGMKTGLAQLTTVRAGLSAQLAAAETAAHSSSPPPGIDKAIAGLKKSVAQIDGKILQIRQGFAAIPQLQGALGKMAAGQAAMATAKVKIASGLSQMATAIHQLENASDIMRIASGAQSVGMGLAKYAAGQAVLRAPVDGLVIQGLPAGEVVMAGAPVVTIRPKGDVLVDVYLEPGQASRVRVGNRAQVAVDSVAGKLAGRVSVVGRTVEFPPANYPTPIVHLANTVHVTISVHDARLPVGIPADVVIYPSS
jgi:multidrug resistance efflux pump